MNNTDNTDDSSLLQHTLNNSFTCVSCGLHTNLKVAMHVTVDSIGDLALVGARVIGQFIGVCNDHQLNKELIQKLMASEETWQYTTLREAKKYWKEIIRLPRNSSSTLSNNKSNYYFDPCLFQ